MKVADLIAYLQTMPPDADVIYVCCSDYQALDAESIRLFKAEEQKIVLRQNHYMDYYASHWGRGPARPGTLSQIYPLSEEPVFVTAVCFPGN
jgi:hypothetical protein